MSDGESPVSAEIRARDMPSRYNVRARNPAGNETLAGSTGLLAKLVVVPASASPGIDRNESMNFSRKSEPVVQPTVPKPQFRSLPET